MTNLNKLCALYDIQTRTEQEALENLLTIHLPKEYTAKVIDKLKENGISSDSQTVRNTKAGISKNILVFNAIVEIAREHKTMSNRLKKILKNNK
ncbi:hypothetical protein [Flavivirga jejuensis]|uniref:Uncharacterized protein n=1 Tax=Flavivirga jejuensis TaxID=870487 RepID=A0ABT8WMM0_9FLAO|nr:hypothetical protein [Flavivirga jejuensis]MDO5974402.1 hypothetical protein [Flavivirga jejuensis]